MSFRLISLIFCVEKHLERTIHRLLTWFLEHHKLLPDAMTHVRDHPSEQHFILNFTSATDKKWNDGMPTITVFMGIGKTFDSVDAG